MHEKEKAIKRQIKGYNSLDKRIKNYDPAAMNGAHTRKGAVKEAQRSVAKSQAASKAKNLEGLGWKSKAGAVAALLGVGAVLGQNLLVYAHGLVVFVIAAEMVGTVVKIGAAVIVQALNNTLE